MKSARYAATIALLGFCVVCTTLPPADGVRDLYEIESVRQYLCAFSIWQDRVPDGIGLFESPYELFAAIADTFKGASYTGYFSARDFGPLAGARHLLNAGSTVKLDSLTPSTVRLEISLFTDSTYEQFLSLTGRLAKFSNIVVDVRGNAGGSLMAMDSIIECFFPAGISYIGVQYRDYSWESRSARTVGWTNQTTKRPRHSSLAGKKYAVLMNGETASAAEILAAALKDGSGAWLVGDTTYGKALAQTIIPRIGRDTLQITAMRFRGVGPHIGEYHRTGIAPDTIVADGGEIAAALALLGERSGGIPKTGDMPQRAFSADVPGAWIMLPPRSR